MRHPLASSSESSPGRLSSRSRAALFTSCVLACAAAPAPVAAETADDPDRQYRFAMALARRGDFGRASAELRIFVEKYPPDADPHDERRKKAGFWLGYCLHKAKKYDGAVEVLGRWTRANPTHELADRAYYWRAESLAAAGRRTEARIEWREVAARFPKSPRAADALESLGWSRFVAGEYERALECAREIGTHFPGRKDVVDRAARLAGESLLKLDRAAEALAEFDVCLARAPAKDVEVKARHGRAAALEDLERHTEAARAYAEVAKLAEGDADLKALVPRAMLSRAMSLISAGKADEALKVIWLLDRRPDRGAAGLRGKFWKGMALEVKGRAAEASRAYEEVLSRPEAGSVHGNAAWRLAELRYDAGDKLGSVAAYDRVVALGDPAEVVAHALYRAAVTLGELGRTADALSRLDRLLREHPESARRADALYAAAEFLVRLERYREAAGRSGEFLLRFPTDERAADVRFLRGWCLNASGETEAARAELEGLLRGGMTGDPAAEAAILLAEIARGNGHIDEAARAYRRAVKAAPRSERAAEALFELSAIAKDAGRAKEAERLARRITKEHPDSPLAPLAEIRASDVALADGRPEEALAGYRSVGARWPGHQIEPAVLSGEAWALLELGRKDEALAAFRALARKHPDSRFGVEALYRSAVLLREGGRAAEAASALAELLRRDPDGRFAQAAVFERALARRSDGDIDGAVAELKGFERSFPGSDLLSEVLCQLALAFFDGDDADAERATWQRILDEFPASPETFNAHYGLAELARTAGDHETAAREYALASASRERPGATEAAFRRAECLVKLGRRAEAWSAFRAVADEFPRSEQAPRALVRAAELALEGGDCGGAIPLLERAETLSPGSAAVLLARALRESGRHRAALAVIEKHVKTADLAGADLRRAKLELALARMGAGRSDEARTGLREVIAGGDDALAARAQYELGEIYLGANRLREADRAFYQLVLLYPFEEWRAKGRFRLGEVNERLRDYARAREFYAELVRENPRSTLVGRARERLAALGP